MAHLYVCEEVGPFAEGQILHLRGDEAHHATTVARLGVGEAILSTDGSGHLAHAIVQTREPGTVSLEVQSHQFLAKPQPEVWLAQALAKGDRDEAAIQMACELGIDGVIPFQAKRSVSVWRADKIAKGRERWRKIVYEASKQSLRAWIPTVGESLDVQGLAALGGRYEIVVLEPEAPRALSGFQPEGVRPLLLVVGPEGGLAPEEIEILVSAGAVALKLGETVLRTSTAGPAALVVLNHKLGRW